MDKADNIPTYLKEDTIKLFETQRQTNMKVFEEFRRHLEQLKVEFYDNYKKKTDSVCAINDFEVTKTLGYGSFGNVVLAKHKTSNKFYAIKILNKERVVHGKQVFHTLNEKYVLSSFRFPFIVHMEFCFKDNCNLYFVLPYLPGGDMFTHLRKSRNFKERDAKFYAAQVILAIEYLHYLQLIYRDLKPENIVIDAMGYIKLTDFGFCKHMVKPRTYTLCGTPEYLAPEIILNRGYGLSVDWWTVGIFLYELISGYTPFYAEEPMLIYEKIVSGKFKFTKEFSTDARDLIRNILQVDLSKRYGNLKDGVYDIKGHSWFKNFDWQSLYNRRITPPYVPKLNSPDDTSHFDDFREVKIQESVHEKFPKEFDEF